jgi:hypothetical protein
MLGARQRIEVLRRLIKPYAPADQHEPAGTLDLGYNLYERLCTIAGPSPLQTAGMSS